MALYGVGTNHLRAAKIVGYPDSVGRTEPLSCGGQGFSGFVAQENPVPIAGGNVTIPESERATNLAYLLLNYTVRVTDLSLAAAGWTNTMQWEADGETRTFPATLRYPGTATGNRQLVIEKVAIGPDKKFKDETYDINVHCTVADKPVPGHPKTVAVESNATASVYAPIGATCSASEEDSKGAIVTVGEPVEITAVLDANFSLRVTKDFTTEAVLVTPRGPLMRAN